MHFSLIYCVALRLPLLTYNLYAALRLLVRLVYDRKSHHSETICSFDLSKRHPPTFGHFFKLKTKTRLKE